MKFFAIAVVAVLGLAACVSQPPSPQPPPPGATPATAAPKPNPIAESHDPNTCFQIDAAGKPHPVPCR